MISRRRFPARGAGCGWAVDALVGGDGGDTYWHRRASGDDPQRMITDEGARRQRARL
jgi:hypothetical protein